MTITARMGAAEALGDHWGLDMARRLHSASQRARTPKARLRAHRAFEAHLADVGATGVRWEPNPQTGKYEMTGFVR